MKEKRAELEGVALSLIFAPIEAGQRKNRRSRLVSDG
jgi:hypothetical protein